MKNLHRTLVLAAAFAALIASTALVSVGAQSAPISDAQIARIRASCVTTTTTLNQLHASDALLRVNRGQLYESIASNLMEPFNGRAQRNGFTIPALLSTTSNYEKQLNTFRADYQRYEESLSAAISTSCTKQPVEFYTAIALARTNRGLVHADVTALNQFLNDYQTGIATFKQDFQTAGSTIQ